MNQFVNTRLMGFIASSPEVAIPVLQWENAYSAFSKAVFSAKEKMERVVYHNSLCFVRAELTFWQKRNAVLKKKQHGDFLHR